SSNKNINLNQEYPNRLYKNFNKLKKWANRENIECFRVYEADIPNYNIIVDIYKDWIIIQEYKAPEKIKFLQAHERLCHAIYHSIKILCIPFNKIILKTRTPQKLGT
ncbi:23S rRNA (guanine(2445)-N(2))/(guanine(2069)-N(7))-methyltransferase, partial [Buchnera aphidicola]|nr:23S rRNA (guanine(2445)-N(2))/(guanine(2069)-N(7))-methyltransferase [Buchnera aphidicola]